MNPSLRNLATKKIPLVPLCRRISSTKPKSAGLMEADGSKSFNKLYHASGFALVGLFPAALILSPSAINMPVDLALGFMFPFHAHVGMNYIISDYVPRATQGAHTHTHTHTHAHKIHVCFCCCCLSVCPPACLSWPLEDNRADFVKILVENHG